LSEESNVLIEKFLVKIIYPLHRDEKPRTLWLRTFVLKNRVSTNVLMLS